MSGKYSKWSAILSVICAVTIFMSYEIAPAKPEGAIKIIIQLLFFTAIITGLLSLIFSFLGFKKKEKGFLKLVAPLLVGLVILTFLVSFILMVFSFL